MSAFFKGAGVFSGLAAVAPDMWQTGDDYFDRQNLMDLRLLSTYGFTESDIEQIRREEGVRGVFATYSADVVASIGGTDYTLRLHGLPDEPARMAEDYMNLPVNWTICWAAWNTRSSGLWNRRIISPLPWARRIKATGRSIMPRMSGGKTSPRKCIPMSM